MKITIIAVLIIGLFAGGAYANMDTVYEHADSDQYMVKAPGMLMRGAMNVFLSPADLLLNTYKHTIKGRPIEGLAHGSHHMLDRGGRGLVDMVFFLAPNFKGFPPKTQYPSMG